MKDIAEQVDRWRREGRRVAVATIVQVERSAPRGPGAAMAVNDRGEVAGSVSGGCVEGALVEEAERVLESGEARLVTYGISDEQGLSVGLTCGGTIHCFVQPLYDEFPVLAEALRRDEPIALCVEIEGPDRGATMLVRRDGTSEGSLGNEGLSHRVREDANSCLARGSSATREYGLNGQPLESGVRLFIDAFVPRPELYIFGAVDFSRALVTLGRYLGYRVTVADARRAFATRKRFPDADEVVAAWPDEFLAQAPVDERTVICVLTHDPKFDVPLLVVALRTNAGYIGAMGSRSTHERRVAELRAQGVSDDELARIRAPIGLDIGATTPEETAVAIAAEIVALRTGHPSGFLASSSGPIHRARFQEHPAPAV
ncbi:XshC-Cox1 family protein [bacterium]|nr:MAG: XshC-Cox1 family protein [bacterium]